MEVEGTWVSGWSLGTNPDFWSQGHPLGDEGWARSLTPSR